MIVRLHSRVHVALLADNLKKSLALTSITATVRHALYHTILPCLDRYF
jgi:hypothetical protein